MSETLDIFVLTASTAYLVIYFTVVLQVRGSASEPSENEIETFC